MVSSYTNHCNPSCGIGSRIHNSQRISLNMHWKVRAELQWIRICFQSLSASAGSGAEVDMELFPAIQNWIANQSSERCETDSNSEVYNLIESLNVHLRWVGMRWSGVKIRPARSSVSTGYLLEAIMGKICWHWSRIWRWIRWHCFPQEWIGLRTDRVGRDALHVRMCPYRRRGCFWDGETTW